ncbi:MAG: hypothetical protein KBF75_11115 [Saprospiraceae bacterium]|nr:hypothetical protein [Saprospiraceae bacterium]HMT76815.1 hypothetical protein [Saprospiraceae bacterium]HQU96211.1 hypothetical protein [Saprospiraceae bacterium]HQW95054.1 hypothetical protein [Saprospiraceae bacterium]
MATFSTIFVDAKVRKVTFYNQINQIIDWTPIEKEINKSYSKGKTLTGAIAYSVYLKR